MKKVTTINIDGVYVDIRVLLMHDNCIRTECSKYGCNSTGGVLTMPELAYICGHSKSVSLKDTELHIEKLRPVGKQTLFLYPQSAQCPLTTTDGCAFAQTRQLFNSEGEPLHCRLKPLRVFYDNKKPSVFMLSTMCESESCPTKGSPYFVIVNREKELNEFFGGSFTQQLLKYHKKARRFHAWNLQHPQLSTLLSRLSFWFSL